jgi:hypothetical protein
MLIGCGVIVAVGATVAVAVEVGEGVAVAVAAGLGVAGGASGELVRPSWLAFDRSSFSRFGEQAAAKISRIRTTYQYLWPRFFVFIAFTSNRNRL